MKSVPVKTKRGEILQIVGAYIMEGERLALDKSGDPSLDLATDAWQLMAQLPDGTQKSLGSYDKDDRFAMHVLQANLHRVCQTLENVNTKEGGEADLIVLIDFDSVEMQQMSDLQGHFLNMSSQGASQHRLQQSDQFARRAN